MTTIYCWFWWKDVRFFIERWLLVVYLSDVIAWIFLLSSKPKYRKKGWNDNFRYYDMKVMLISISVLQKYHRQHRLSISICTTLARSNVKSQRSLHNAYRLQEATFVTDHGTYLCSTVDLASHPQKDESLGWMVCARIGIEHLASTCHLQWATVQTEVLHNLHCYWLLFHCPHENSYQFNETERMNGSGGWLVLCAWLKSQAL